MATFLRRCLALGWVTLVGFYMHRQLLILNELKTNSLIIFINMLLMKIIINSMNNSVVCPNLNQLSIINEIVHMKINLPSKLSIPLVTPAAQLLVIIILCLISIWIYQSCPQPVVSVVTNDCRLSIAESDGYFCESNNLWNERKRIYRFQDKENMKKYKDPIYFVKSWEPNFHCAYARRIGIMGDGGKWVCDPYRLKLRQDCLIYSAGSSGDFSFEIDIKKYLPNCEIHTFDKNEYLCPPKTCTFHKVIFGDGIKPNGSTSWPNIVQALNHVNRTIDILKIDVEGGEFTFFPHLLKWSKSSYPRQILIEIHPTNVDVVYSLFETLREYHYVIFNKENNLYAGPYFFEYGFLKLNPDFFVL